MIESEREKLLGRTSEYLSIGITDGGKAPATTHIPWEKTVHAHNMKTPDVYLAPEDLEDDDVLKTLHGYRVIGCYIYTPLKNYDFISLFTELRDLNIYRGEGIRDLNFLLPLRECDMLYLEGARLDNLNPIAEVKRSVKGIFGGFRCLALCDCEIRDITSLYGVSFSELIIWSKNEKERWSKIPAATHRYYEL